MISYKTIGERRNYVIRNQELAKDIDEQTEDKSSKIKSLIKFSLDITSDRLNYTFENNSNDPNELYRTKTAHCVGYAAYQASVLNRIFKNKGLKEWKARPLAGQLYFCGINIHSYLKNPFFRDHDFVEIKNSVTGECFYSDPTIYDYLNITFISHK
jgi:hypothetical protein